MPLVGVCSALIESCCGTLLSLSVTRSTADVYRQFQHDVYRLRLEAARGYAAVLQKGLSPVSANAAEPVKLHVQVSLVARSIVLVFLYSLEELVI